MPDDPVPGLPAEVNAKPIVLGAFTPKNLIRGEPVMLYLDRSGRITISPHRQPPGMAREVNPKLNVHPLGKSL